jgi:hypothetical protein
VHEATVGGQVVSAAYAEEAKANVKAAKILIVLFTRILIMLV